jgi:hypothetical protein
MHDSAPLRRLAMLAAVGAILLAATPDAGAARYKGERVDIYSGRTLGRWIITTRETAGGAVLATVVRCRPRGRCRPFPRRLRLELARESEYAYTGAFRLGAVACTLDAYVYPDGFEGVYACDDQSQGSISGRRA